MSGLPAGAAIAAIAEANLDREKGVIFLILIKIEEGEPIERALKRFKKECQKSGVLTELRKREFYEKPSVRRKRADEAATRKHRRRLQKLQSKLEMM